jgi:xanthine dehydrogenase accessory factor
MVYLASAPARLYDSDMQFIEHLILIRGGGDLATGVAYRLHKAGFPIVVLELEQPLVVRRRVALATAVFEGQVSVEELQGQLVSSVKQAWQLAHEGTIPVFISPELSNWKNLARSNTKVDVPILIDARMAKRNIDTSRDQAGLVVGLGPGFTAGTDCHAVVETMRGHRLGRVIWDGSAEPNTGTPGIVAGKEAERVLRAPIAGRVSWKYGIGDIVDSGVQIGSVADVPIEVPFMGVLRGLIAPGLDVPMGLKIGDLDARKDVAACFTISDKALAIGGGALEAILTWLNSKNQ